MVLLFLSDQQKECDSAAGEAICSQVVRGTVAPIFDGAGTNARRWFYKHTPGVRESVA